MVIIFIVSVGPGGIKADPEIDKYSTVVLKYTNRDSLMTEVDSAMQLLQGTSEAINAERWM